MPISYTNVPQCKSLPKHANDIAILAVNVEQTREQLAYTLDEEYSWLEKVQQLVDDLKWFTTS